MSVDDIFKEIEIVKDGRADLFQVVITGGEPLEQDISDLVKLLRKKRYFVSLETNGNHSIDFEFDWITVSPKDVNGYFVDNSIAARINEIKLLVTPHLDVKTIKHIRSLNKNIPIFLQPQFFDDDKLKKTYDIFTKCISSEIKNIRLGFQLHKLYDIQ